MQFDHPLGGGDEQRLPAAEVIRRGTGRQTRAGVDGAVRHPVHAYLDEQRDRGVRELRPATVIGWRHDVILWQHP
ncbi:hypothetical protein Raf01_23410 [Rugosimonospora africana]|uniref:Uncharacterized protein n=1 Tax=Rugosimonospora africana TaxID=556532 RepID=A0A8J3VPJ1_9ACTN|nr:hypothetical protein Raf01_23410 [Rugosimonospora africana]